MIKMIEKSVIHLLLLSYLVLRYWQLDLQY